MFYKGLLEKKKKCVDLDELLQDHLGEFGLFQRLLFSTISIEIIFICMQVMGPVFLAGVPPYWCHLPNNTHTTQNCTLDQMKASILPSREVTTATNRWQYSQCEIYNKSSMNGSCDISNINVNRTKHKCEQWTYGEDHYRQTLVSEVSVILVFWDVIYHNQKLIMTNYTSPIAYPIYKFATIQARRSYYSTSQPAYESPSASWYILRAALCTSWQVSNHKQICFLFEWNGLNVVRMCRNNNNNNNVLYLKRINTWVSTKAYLPWSSLCSC